MYKYFKSSGKYTCDCSVRAVMVVTGWDWYKAYDALCAEGRKKKDMPNAATVVESFLLKEGFEKVKVCVSKGSKRPLVKELATQYPKHRVFVNVANHFVGCKGGDYYDLWDSGNKSAYSYYIKPME